MPALGNARHERFAQAVADGKSATAAYEMAGYKPDPGNAANLQKRHDISQRISELLQERAYIQAAATAVAIERTALTKEWIIERLMENVARAMQAECPKDEDGNPTGDYRYDGSVANKALELLGKECGMFIDRKEVGKPGEFESLNADDLRAHITRENAALGISTAPPAATNGAGKPH